jgi:hypothetical protein
MNYQVLTIYAFCRLDMQVEVYRKGGMWKVIVFGYELSSANTLRFLQACFGRRGIGCFKL